MNLTFENMTVDLNMFNLGRQPSDPFDQSLDVNLIRWVPSEYFKDEYMETNINYTNKSLRNFLMKRSYYLMS